MEQIYLSDNQVSQMTGKAVQSIRNERYKRIGIPYIKMGGSVRYDIKDVIEYMEARRVKTTSHVGVHSL